jgi:DNA-binding transcriptional ArsR family regulator
MDSKTRMLYWLIDASRGGPTRLRLLKTLHEKPVNLRQLSLAMGLNYKTTQEHIRLLLENGIVDRLGKGYGSLYFISSEYDKDEYLKKSLEGGSHEKERRRKEKEE